MRELAERNEVNSLRQSDWPLRPWLLGAMLALCGLAVHFLVDAGQETPWRLAGAAFFAFGGIAAAFTLDEGEWKAPAIFALAVGLVMAGLAFNAIDLEDRVAGEEFSFAAGVFAAALAVPLFQSGFHRLRFRTPYVETHYNVWTDAISAGGALAFTGLSWLVIFLLDQLFRLIDITVIGDIMDEDWFIWAFSAGAFGAALGVLRNQLVVLGTLQKVVMLVLALLAMPLAVALILFLIPLALSGGEVLWNATRNPTPVLLGCAAGAFVLVNAVIRDSDDHRSQSRIMLVAAAILAFGVFPLSLFAAISMGARVGQYGLAPERIWGFIAIGVALAYGLAYWFGLLRGRVAGWCRYLRQANFTIAVGVCALALFLALPIIDFGAISARNQLGRLASGAVSAEDFDYDALRWDFGKAGRDALDGLAKSDNARVAELAKEAQERGERPWRGYGETAEATDRLANLRTEIADPETLASLQRFLRDEPWRCQSLCTVVGVGTGSSEGRHLVLVEGENLSHLRVEQDGHIASFYPGETEAAKDIAAPTDTTVTATEPIVEVRPYAGRQIYVNGKPIGQPFE